MLVRPTCLLPGATKIIWRPLSAYKCTSLFSTSFPILPRGCAGKKTSLMTKLYSSFLLPWWSKAMETDGKRRGREFVGIDSPSPLDPGCPNRSLLSELTACSGRGRKRRQRERKLRFKLTARQQGSGNAQKKRFPFILFEEKMMRAVQSRGRSVLLELRRNK